METKHQTSDVNRQVGAADANAPVDPPIHIRPLEPWDRAAVRALFERLSPESRHRRFLGPKPALSAQELRYLTVVDHRRHEALAAVDERDGSIVGVARYACVPGCLGVADVALAVADDQQRQGIGGALARALISRARVNGFRRLTATTGWENRPARALLRALGFHACSSQGSLIELELHL